MFYCNLQAWVQPLPAPELDDSPGNIDTVAMIIRVAYPLVCTLAYTIDGWHRELRTGQLYRSHIRCQCREHSALRCWRSVHQRPLTKKNRSVKLNGLGLARDVGATTAYCITVREPTTSTVTRRFLTRPSAVRLSAIGCASPLPSVYTRDAWMPLEIR